MTDERRFAVAFREDVHAALAGLAARPGTRRLALGLERACAGQLAHALGPAGDRGAWSSLWLGIAEVVAFGASGDAGAVRRLRAFLDENRDLLTVDGGDPAGIVRLRSRRILTYGLASRAADAADAPTPWVLGAWSTSAVLLGVAIAVRAFST